MLKKDLELEVVRLNKLNGLLIKQVEVANAIIKKSDLAHNALLEIDEIMKTKNEMQEKQIALLEQKFKDISVIANIFNE